MVYSRRQNLILQIRKSMKPIPWKAGDVLYLLFIFAYLVYIGTHIPWPTWVPVVPIAGIMASDPLLVVSPLGKGTTKAPVVSTVHHTEPIPVVILPTSRPTPVATLENIISEIAATFKPEGESVVVEAINCFHSESKFNPKAYNYNNKSKTSDRGIAQINSIHQLSDAEAYDFRKNVRKAYEIYKKSGWKAWYGRGCSKLSYENR